MVAKLKMQVVEMDNKDEAIPLPVRHLEKPDNVYGAEIPLPAPVRLKLKSYNNHLFFIFGLWIIAAVALGVIGYNVVYPSVVRMFAQFSSPPAELPTGCDDSLYSCLHYRHYQR